ncbi:hypothetical protein MP228_010263 [Amoeboaphelidium protococcarum]|nr:hypothetical protein MP228_010263 [Amoeboaphelidium protococcarum]
MDQFVELSGLDPTLYQLPHLQSVFVLKQSYQQKLLEQQSKQFKFVDGLVKFVFDLNSSGIEQQNKGGANNNVFSVSKSLNAQIVAHQAASFVKSIQPDLILVVIDRFDEHILLNAVQSIQQLANCIEVNVVDHSTDNQFKQFKFPCHIVIVVNTAEVKEFEDAYGSDMVDFVQQALRVLALQFNCTLFFTNTFKSENVRGCLQYLMQNIDQDALQYSKDNQVEPEVVDRESLFVPAGWDSMGKMLVLNEQFDYEKFLVQNNNNGLDFTDVISHCRIGQSVDTTEVQTQSQILDDYQRFLQQLSKQYGISSATAPSPGPLAGGGGSKSKNSSQQDLLQTSSAAASGGADSASSTQNQVLANFFSSLLKKGGGGGGAQSSGSTSSSIGSSQAGNQKLTREQAEAELKKLKAKQQSK